MGITIHYSGTFRSDASLTDMIQEAVAYAKLYNWEYHLLETSFDAPERADFPKSEMRYGISINPPMCESVHLYFNHERQLGFYHELEGMIVESWIGDEETGIGKWVPEVNAEDYKPHWGAFTKTAFAGKRIHMQVVELLRKISEKYFEHFKVMDESGYWDHGNAQLLDYIFGEEDMLSNGSE